MGASDRGMTILLDTAVAVWLDVDPRRLSGVARDLVEDGAVRCMLSVASVWEMEVKCLAGKLSLSGSVREAVDHLVRSYALEILDLTREACHQLPRLPFLHRDPFDRLLMCQGIASGLPILTPDPIFAKYPIRTVW